MTNKRGIKIYKPCYFCKKHIEISEKWVCLGTYEGNKTIEEEFFHMQCFSQWYNQKIEERVKNTVSTMQNKALQLLKNPMIANILGNVQGIGTITTMLKTPLNKKQNIELYHKDKIQELKEKIKHGRTKSKKSKSKKRK